MCAMRHEPVHEPGPGGQGPGSTAPRLGGEGWQKRKARLKERIREIANELLRTAAARALRRAPVLEAEENAFNQFVEGPLRYLLSRRFDTMPSSPAWSSR